ncbi:MAG: metal ABC transporter substrate-binding protein [Planctomycetota bacterium]
MNRMRNINKSICYVMLLSVLFSAGCSKKEEAAVEKGKQIFASNYPLAYFAEQISGKPELVYFPEIDGDPVFWEPTINDITEMQQADIVFINGATYEKWLEKVSLAKEHIHNTSASFQDEYISIEDVTTHSHGPSGAHSHAGTAFTTWIDFTQALRQAEAVKDALVSAGMGTEEELTANFNRLKEQLLALDTSINQIATGHSEVPLFASHPVYQYFSRRYRLNIKSVMWEPDAFPDEAMWKELETLQKEHQAAWMIWEDEPLPESVKRLEIMGIRSIVFSPCGNRPEQGVFMTVMEKNVENLRLISW